ncbi:MAG: acetyltransferase [Paracoccaceae bacterium]|nr:acetyltransferase [Paracoccaceae bacterium]
MSQFQQFKYVDSISNKQKILRQIWSLVYLVAFRPTPRGLMHGWRRFLLRAFGAKIGAGSKISPSCFVWAPWNLEMGELSVLGDHVDCYTMNKIRIGSKVAVSQRSFLCTGTHDVTSLRRPLQTYPITISDHVWIAAEAMVMPGCSIGTGAVIGARSVVRSDMPAWKICVGDPCRPVRDRLLDDTSSQLVQLPNSDGVR